MRPDQAHRGDLRGEPQLRQPVRRVGGRRTGSAGRRVRPCQPRTRPTARALPCLPQNDVNLASPTRCRRRVTARSTGVTVDSAFANQPFASTTTSRRRTRPARRRASSPRTACSTTRRGAARRLHRGPRPPLLPGAVPDQRRRAGPVRHRQRRGRPRRWAATTPRRCRSTSTCTAPTRRATSIADNFFQGAFGGSFLNHQWLIAAATPVWPGAVADGSANDLHSIVGADGSPANYPLHPSTGLKDAALTQAANPDGSLRGARRRAHPAGRHGLRRLRRQHHPAVLPAVRARYRGRAAAPAADHADDRRRAVGEATSTGPGTPAAGTTPTATSAAPAGRTAPPRHLRRPGHHRPRRSTRTARTSCSSSTTSRSTTTRTTRRVPRPAPRTCATRTNSSHAAKHGTLKPVSFVKPIGAENEHPGYASEHDGSDHLVDLLTAIENRPGRQEHARSSSPTTSSAGSGTTSRRRHASGISDQFGPGTRVPALVISPLLDRRFAVDHTSHDTTSIMATIEHQYGLAPLGPRDAAVRDLSADLGLRHRH